MSEKVLPILGICGLAGSGKDTVAGMLANYGYRRVAWADALKEEVFWALWDSGVLEEIDGGLGMLALRQSWLDYIDANKRDPHHWVRPFLQWWGTDFRRRYFGDDYWVKRLVLEPGVAVSDCRFPNEAEAIRQAGGVVIKIVRPSPKQSWWQRTWSALRGAVRPTAKHASEWLVESIATDYTIVNDGTLAELGGKVEELARWLESREETA